MKSLIFMCMCKIKVDKETSISFFFLNSLAISNLRLFDNEMWLSFYSIYRLLTLFPVSLNYFFHGDDQTENDWLYRMIG